MTNDPEWVSLLEKILPIIMPIGTFVLGKMMKGGANQLLLDQAVAKIVVLEATSATHTTLLAGHTILHDSYVQRDALINKKLDLAGEKLGYITGVLSGSKNTKRFANGGDE